MPSSARFAPSNSTFIEKLEARIAPAVLVNPKTLTYTDVDGDLVTVTISKGTLTAADFVFDTPFESTTPQQLQLVDFAGDHSKTGTDITISAVHAATVVANGVAVGDGFVDIGYLNATGIDLGKVSIGGDLGRLDAGDANLATTGVKRIEVSSLGVRGTDTQASGGNLTTHIKGALGSLVTTGDVQTATIFVTGAINAIDIGGSLIGSTDAQSGAVSAGGVISSAIVGVDIIGGVGSKSGQIASFDGIGTVQVGGSVKGGEGFESGAVGSHGVIADIAVTHDIVGGSGEASGALLSSATIKHATVGGDISGGGGVRSGVIATDGGLGSVIVQGSVFGDNGQESGSIGSNGSVGNVKVFGSVEGGNGNQSGRIVSKASLGKVVITGSLFGGSGTGSGAIGAHGPVNLVQVGGDLIGSSGDLSGWISSDKQLGTVTVNGALGFFGGNVGLRGAQVGRSSFFGSGLISGPVIGKITVGNIGLSDDELDPGSIQGGSIGSITVTNSIYSSFFTSAFISARSIGSIAVGQDVLGVPSFSNGSGSPVKIEVRNSLGSLTVGGDAEYLSLVAGGGFDPVEQPPNPDAKIGTVRVSGDWVASIVVAGVFAGDDGVFGTLDDTVATGGNSAVVSTIARIQIAGSISGGQLPLAPVADGAPRPGDPFGFIAQHIVALSVGGSSVPLKAGPGNDSKFLNFSTSVFVRENNKELLD